VWVVHHEGEWGGGNSIMVDGQDVSVRECPSELAVREALANHADDDGPLVLLTPVDELGQDVLARVARRRISRLHVADAVMHLFGVGLLDPQLLRHHWLLEALVDAAPPEGYDRTGANELDADRAWAALLTQRYGLDPRGGLTAVLEWADTPGGHRLVEASPVEQSAVQDRLAGTVPGSRPVTDLILASRGEDAIGFGLAARLLAAAPDSSIRAAARVRAELIGESEGFAERDLAALANAAELATSGHIGQDDARANELLAEGEQMVETLQAGELAVYSPVLRSGLHQRQVALANRVRDGNPGPELDEAVAAVQGHRLAEMQGATAQAELVRRLMRYLASPDTTAEDLRPAAQLYASDGAYADRARLALRDATGVADLDEALRELVAKADERRGTEERQFATLLGSWVANAETGPHLLGVEDVLSQVVRPLASHGPALFVLLDGMSHRVASELLEGLLRAGWTELRRDDHPSRALVLSTLPSVTQYSRASLFEGNLVQGTATDEEKSFAAQTGLGHGSAGPRLFHKKAIADDHAGLTEELRDEIAGTRRTVGIVVNAIDDHLARSEQLHTAWGPRDIRPLWLLLEAARDAGRTVVLASDHGHVIEHGTTLRSSAGGGGERWRAVGDAGDGEVVVDGPRVIATGNRCVLAWDETIRYGAKKNGYHGGGTAQEVVAPLLVITPDLSDVPDGWVEAPLDPPAWWTGDKEVEVDPTPSAVEQPEPESKPGQQLSLGRSGVEDPGWVDRLIASETFAGQRAAAGRTPLPDERVRVILMALDANSGRLLREALGRASGIAPLRLTGTLAALRQLLNVDGYPVLEVDDQTGDVYLDIALLKRQFGLS